MSSTQKTAIFMYAGKSFPIPCKGKEKIIDMILKFMQKFNPNSKYINYNFSYEGTKIEKDVHEKYVEDIDYFSKNEPFIITVEKNIKVIECPKCNYGDCVVSLIGYKTIFYNCEHKHLHISSYDNYFTDQIYYPEKIKCAGNNCNKTAKMDPNFLLCLSCAKLLGKTISICQDCADKHKKEYQNKHTIINYEDKNYFCKDHIKKMEKYCFQCKQNMCDDCAKEHLNDKEKFNGHNIKNISLLIPAEKEITALKNSLEEIKKNTESLKIVIDDLIYTLKGAMRMYQNYYKIACNIIEKYESFNKDEGAFKNFTIFKCLRNLKVSNDQILGKLKSIINKKDKLDKAKDLIEIYSNKKKNYYANEKVGDDLNKEDDGDWLKEILEKEEKILAKKSSIDIGGKKPIKIINKKATKK